jgi:NAD(P)-dependent dehydrogenase (short-subunit alcohol dehydrogenase family)
MASRNPEKSAAVKAALEKSYPGTDIEVLSLDLASFASIRQFASIMALKKYSINTLINNAGVLPAKFSLTEDGFETALGVNYLGLFLLNELLLPLMRPGSLIINTISCSYRIGRLHQEMFRSKPEARFMRIFNYAVPKGQFWYIVWNWPNVLRAGHKGIGCRSRHCQYQNDRDEALVRSSDRCIIPSTDQKTGTGGRHSCFSKPGGTNACIGIRQAEWPLFQEPQSN